MGIRDAIGDRWARFRAYLHSIPPHVWVGLIIGAIALVLAYLAWKNRNDPLSPLSQITPLSDTTTTTTTPAAPTPTPVSLPGVPDLGNLIYPPGQYYNYNTQHPVTQATPTPGVAAFNTQIGYDIHQQSLLQRAQAAAASLLQSASAPQHSYDIHAASANLAAIQAQQQTAVNNFHLSEIGSWTAPLTSVQTATQQIQSTAIQNFHQSEIGSWTTPLAAPAPAPRPILRPPTAYTAPKLTTTPTQRGTNVSF